MRSLVHPAWEPVVYTRLSQGMVQKASACQPYGFPQFLDWSQRNSAVWPPQAGAGHDRNYNGRSAPALGRPASPVKWQAPPDRHSTFAK